MTSTGNRSGSGLVSLSRHHPLCKGPSPDDSIQPGHALETARSVLDYPGQQAVDLIAGAAFGEAPEADRHLAGHIRGLIDEDHIRAVGDVCGILFHHLARHDRRAECEELRIVVECLGGADIRGGAFEHVAYETVIVDRIAAIDDRVLRRLRNVRERALALARDDVMPAGETTPSRPQQASQPRCRVSVTDCQS